MTDEIQERPTKPIKLNPKQKQTLVNWFSEDSETFGNLYKSALKAGFRPSYALNLTNKRPKWLTEMVESAQFEPEHLKQGVQNLAKSAPNSKSPDDTRLKAYELLGKWTGLEAKTTQQTTVVIPILNNINTQEKEKKVDIEQG